jgi:hypothetical protein
MKERYVTVRNMQFRACTAADNWLPAITQFSKFENQNIFIRDCIQFSSHLQINYNIMVRPTYDLESYKDEKIIDWFQHGITVDIIVERLNQQFQVLCSCRTIQRRLQKWGIYQRTITQDTSELRAQIAILFHANLSDTNIVRALKQSGVSIEVTAVVRIRKNQGLIRRMTPFERPRSDERLFDILKKELENGRVEGFGRDLL